VGNGAETFRVPADAYDRYMGVWSRLLASPFADAAGVERGQTALDVGCGIGTLTVELASRLGGDAVAAIDPSEPSVAACAAAVPEADVRLGSAESLPFADATFDRALCQLAVNFMSDARRGVRELRRVTRSGGAVAACTWDYGEGMTMLRVFFDAAVEVDPTAPDEREMPYCTPTALRQLWEDEGLAEIRTDEIVVERTYASFDDYWEPFTFGVGPAGSYCVSLDADRREAVRQGCFRQLGEPSGPLRLTARAWFVRGAA
jgi:ubiquinone/menaquinone biosynthesis C-methylase UbiE